MRGRPPYLDREMCFDLWMELDSLDKVRSRLVLDGIINPNTGKPPSQTGVKAAAWKWVFYNLDETLERFRARYGLYEGEDVKYWLKKIEKRAFDLLMTKADRYIDWHRNYYEPHEKKCLQDILPNT